MIISASRRTDIPAFYPNWFMKRIEEGFFVKINPLNSKQKKLISLLPNDVDVIVFWSKNPAPMLKCLPILDSMGYKYYFQFTVNNYSPIFEPNLPYIEKRLDMFKELSVKLGKNRVIWRYDPIILSNKTTINYHMENIQYLSEHFKNYTDKCVFSFLDFYGKVGKRLEKLKEEKGIQTFDICQEEYLDIMLNLLGHIKKTLDQNNIRLASCAEGMNLEYLGIQPNCCIDGDLINEILGNFKVFKKDPGQRRECHCVESVDVGMYNTCLHKCSYCYANYSNKSIDNNYIKHNIDSPILIGDLKLENDILRAKNDMFKQGKLF